MNKLLLLIALFLVGCGTTTPSEPKIYIQFSLSESNFQNTPNIRDAVTHAIKAWENTGLIKANLYTQGYLINTIPIYVIDLQNFPLFAEDGVIGLFYNGIIWLDDSIETNWPTPIGGYALAVSIHEIGHALGLPHIIGEDTCIKMPGDIILPTDLEAQHSVMYPRLPFLAEKIGPHEIELLRNKLGL